MIFVIIIGFSDIQNFNLQDKNSKIYFLVFIDIVCVIVVELVVFIGEVFVEVDVIFFFFKDEDEVQLIFKKEKRDL